MSKKIIPAELLAAAKELEEKAQMLRELARQLTEGGDSIERDAVENLTRNGRKMVSFLLSRGGKERWTVIKEQLELDNAQFGGIIGGAKKRTIVDMPPVFDYIEKLDGEVEDYLIGIEPRYMDAARELETEL